MLNVSTKRQKRSAILSHSSFFADAGLQPYKQGWYFSCPRFTVTAKQLKIQFLKYLMQCVPFRLDYQLFSVVFVFQLKIFLEGYFVMMYIFSVYYRRVFMNQLKLVDQKIIIIVLVLLYFLNLKILELIPAAGHRFVSLSFVFVFVFVFCNSKE